MRQTDVRQHHRLMPPPIRGGSIIINALLQAWSDQDYTNVTCHTMECFLLKRK